MLRPDEMLTGETTDAAEGTSAGTNTSMGTVLAGISSGMPLPGRCHSDCKRHCPAYSPLKQSQPSEPPEATLSTRSLLLGLDNAHAALDVLVVRWQAGLIVASILRAVDYLNARPDVDPDRICVMSGTNLFFEVRPIAAELAVPCRMRAYR